MPKISFKLTDNTSRNYTILQDEPAGVAVPLPYKHVDEFPDKIEFANKDEWDVWYKTNGSNIFEASDETQYITSNALISLLLNSGYRVIACPVDVGVNVTTATREVLSSTVQKAIIDGLYEDLKSRNVFNIQFITTGAFAGIIPPVVATFKVIDDVWQVSTDGGIDWTPLETKVDNDPSATGQGSADNITIDKDTGYWKIGDKVTTVKAPKDADNKPESALKVMAGVASTRGDCIALIELPDNSSLLDVKNYATQDATYGNGKTNDELYRYAAAFYPQVKLSLLDGVVQVPACIGYLLAYARSISSNPNYFATAGVSRGVIPYLDSVVTRVTDAFAEVINGGRGDDKDNSRLTTNFVINPIMNIYGYGNRIFGNRTCRYTESGETLKYVNFLNVMILVNDLFKRMQQAASVCTFDPNDNGTWVKFLNLVNPLLESMKANRGITYYRWVKETVEEKGLIKATLHVRPIEAVEDFVLTVNLVDDEGIATLEVEA